MPPISWCYCDKGFCAEVRARLTRIEGLLAQIYGKEIASTMTLQDDIATLQTKVAANTTVVGSAVTLLQGLSGQVASLKQQLADAGATPDQLAAIESFTTQLDAGTQSLAAAVAANTAAPTQPAA